MPPREHEHGPDEWALYRTMARSRRFEQLVARLWTAGQISGEMHLSAGEEAIAVGVVDQLREHDALALDHRGTAPLVARGVELGALLDEMLGLESGLCRGRGGHMHLFAPAHRAAASGIVGSAGPLAAGFGLAQQQLHPGSVAAAFFGEGAINQGMLLESLNLAASWRLPVLFVCKDDGWAVSTRSASVTAGSVAGRARAFGLRVFAADGGDAVATWRTAARAVAHVRERGAPAFLHARCVHLEGHFLGDPLLRIARHPVTQGHAVTPPLLRALVAPRGAGLAVRAAALGATAASVVRSALEHGSFRDPLPRLRRRLLARDAARLGALEAELAREIDALAARAGAAATAAAPDDAATGTLREALT